MAAGEGSDALAGLAEVAETADGAAATDTASQLGSELEAVAATAATETGEGPTGETNSTTGRGARDRIQQLVGTNNELTTQLETLQAQQQSSQESIHNLTEIANQGRADTEIIQAIRTLNADPRYSDMVQSLDRALSGDEPEVDTTDMSPEEVVTHENRLLEQRLEQAEDLQAQAVSDALLNRADQIADRWLDDLPEEYTQEDREVIGTLWNGFVDWDGLEGSGDPQAHLEPHLRETLQQAIDLFQQPRGGLVESGSEIQQTPVDEADPVEALQQAIAERQYGEVQHDDRGKASLAISDDDFAGDLAAVMKARQD